MNAAALVTPCQETQTQQPAKTKKVFAPIKPWITREQMHALVSRQPLQSWEEKVAQINRSLGRPQGSP